VYGVNYKLSGADSDTHCKSCGFPLVISCIPNNNIDYTLERSDEVFKPIVTCLEDRATLAAQQ
jgi:hypothetical protein